jgi:fatty-acyl-CoA synthase
MTIRSETKLTESYWPAEESVPQRYITSGQLLADAAADSPNALALIEGIGDAGRARRWTFAELHDAALDTAAALIELFAPGAHLAVWAPNRPEWMILQYGAAFAGLTLVTMNPGYTQAEAAYVLGQSKAEGVVLDRDHRGGDLAAIVEKLRPDLPALREVLDLAPDSPLWAKRTSEPALPDVAPEDPAMIQYTSGTTGAPKGALLTHGGLVNNAHVFADRFGIERGAVWLNPMPMFHIAGCQLDAMGAIWSRAPHVLMSWEPGLALELVERERVAFLPGVPTMLIGMLEHPDFQTRDLSSLKFMMSGGTPVAPELVRRVEASFGVRYGMIFGQTETSGIVGQSRPDDAGEDKTERVGQPVTGTEVKIADPETGHVLPCDTIGEICVRGAGAMLGYFEMPEATAAAIDADRWLHTGDLGTMDNCGYLQVTGRLKDMIISGGENIYPRQIEDVLHTHPGVGDAAVLGTPHDYWGEQVVACIRPAAGTTPDPARWRNLLRKNLAGQKVPKRWFLVDAMPLTPSGKIQKFRLRDQIENGTLTEVTP